MNKTNAMRKLDKAGIKYEPIEYVPDDSDLSGVHIAKQTGLPPEIMFKTLVVRGEKRGLLVFCIPVNAELDLKKCAAVAGDKRVELVAVKELLGLTGYIRGGCSPIGMKKDFPTYFDETVILYDKITISAGIKGCQLMLSQSELIDFIGATVADLTVL